MLLPLASVAEKGESPYRDNPFASPPGPLAVGVPRSPALPLLCEEKDASARVLWAVPEGGEGGGVARGPSTKEGGLGLQEAELRLVGVEMCMRREPRAVTKR